MSAFRGSRLVSLLSFAGALAALAGCSQQAGSTSAVESTGTSEQAVSTVAADGEGAAVAQGPGDDASVRPARPEFGRPHGPPHGPPGPEGLLMVALHELELTAEQKTQIQAALDKSRPEPKAQAPLGGAPVAELAQGVRAGTIDKAALLTKLGKGGALDKGAEAHVAALASSLETLHATLTKEQRGALVDALQKRAEGPGPGGERGPGAGGERGPRPSADFAGKIERGPRPGADFAAKGERGPREGGRRPPEPGANHLPGPLGFLLDGIELTQAQRDAIAKAFEARQPSATERESTQKRHEVMRAIMHERLASFVGDAFDAKTFVTPPTDAKAGGPGNPFEHMIDDLAIVTPLLDPTQREALAVRLEKGPPVFEGRPGEHPRRAGR